MIEIDRELEVVKHVARLARLRIEDEELREMASHFKKILNYVEILDELDLENVDPMPYPHKAKQRLREDIPGEGLSREEVLEEAPDVFLHFIRSPSPLKGIVKRQFSE
jgi:aspartyl-tRNA(Asn)/glutamyl-tRNA(Gln) amidotransferase subunit C